MGFVGLLEIALRCFDVLAWPLLALVYPLCCSIRAIETNSISDTQKLNTYWVVFSLFQHAFLELVKWFPLWPYIRILIVFCLVIPHFDGAFYVYKHFICPCLTMEPPVVVNWFNMRRKESLLIQESFLTEVERYAKENGPESSERIVACKVSQTEPNLTGTGNNKFTALEVEMGREAPEPNGDFMKEWTPAFCEVTTPSEETLDPEMERRKLEAEYEALKAKNQVYLPQIAPAPTLKKSDQPIGEEGKTTPSQGHENTIPASITKKYDEPKEKPAEGVSSNGLKRNIIINFKESVQGQAGQQQNPHKVSTMMGSGLWCKICSVRCSGEISMASHLNGRKHKENVQERKQKAKKVPRKNDLPLWCKTCSVGCPGVVDLLSHINGKKHKENVQNADKVQRKK